MKTLYFDCFAGASGNMMLGALVSAGLDEIELRRQISLLNLPQFEIDFAMVDRSGIASIHAQVTVPAESVHRHLSQIERIIGDSALSEGIRRRAIRIFTRLAEAEAKVHGIEQSKVHFHEVGALDAIIDIVGACIGFEVLGIERFACSKIHVGSGFVDMAHGKFPVPPPAVSELLKGKPIYSTEIVGELITPTGAAIISTLCDDYGAIPAMDLQYTGYGAGTRTYEGFPNVLRLMIGETQESTVTLPAAPMEHTIGKITEALSLLETNIDDISPQILGFVMQRAFEIGALDCWFTPIQMKKNRPANAISILCTAEKQDMLSELLYTETTTLGIRVSSVRRESLEREIVSVGTRFGPVDVKIARMGGTIINAVPEYEQVKQIALENTLAFQIVRDIVVADLDNPSLAAQLPS